MQNIFRANNIPAFVICFLHMLIVYGISVAMTEDALIGIPIALGVYILLFLITISPVGEAVFRVFCGARRIRRADWQNKIDMITTDVVSKAQNQDNTLPCNINFYYINDPIPSTLAIGRHTICITSGLLDMSISNIKGCVAHEIGHISSYDSSITQVANVGNFFVFLLGLLFQSFYLFNNWTSRFTRRGMRSLMRNVLSFLPVAIITGIIGITRFVLNIGYRAKEYQADLYAVRLGYGNELHNALLAIDFDSQSGRRNLWRMLVAEHPSVHDRVGRIDEQIHSNNTPATRRRTDLYNLLNR